MAGLAVFVASFNQLTRLFFCPPALPLQTEPLNTQNGDKSLGKDAVTSDDSAVSDLSPKTDSSPQTETPSKTDAAPSTPGNSSTPQPKKGGVMGAFAVKYF